MARYPVYRKPRRQGRRLLIWSVFLAIIAGGTWYIFFRDKSPDPQKNKTDKPTNSAGSGNLRPVNITPPAGNDNTTTKPLDKFSGTLQQRQQAINDFQAGMKRLGERKILQARSVLSKALLSGFLDAATQKKACKQLTILADKTIFSRKAFDDDPYTLLYPFEKGDILQRVRRKLRLHVPWQILLKINSLKSARRIREGQRLKMIKGPFHAIVYKKRHIMDLYLHRKGLDRVFVRRLTVGLGKEGSTPVGSWKVKNRLPKAPWTKTGSDGRRRTIIYGRPGYAFGKKGIWIGLVGTNDKTKLLTGYGIHSTNEPSSIGKDASEGCIRLSDKDIDLVYATLQENWSTVEIKE